MTPTQKVALWERVNAYAETCGADTSEGAVGADRQRRQPLHGSHGDEQ